jgi:hypothetical protein
MCELCSSLGANSMAHRESDTLDQQAGEEILGLKMSEFLQFMGLKGKRKRFSIPQNIMNAGKQHSCHLYS